MPNNENDLFSQAMGVARATFEACWRDCPEKHRAIIVAHMEGQKLRQIAKKHDVTHERIRQILQKYCLVAHVARKLRLTEKRGRIIDLYLSGMNMEQVAGKTHVCVSTVAKCLKDANLGPRPSGHPSPATVAKRMAVHQAIAEEYRNGKSIAMIAAKQGIAPGTVHRALILTDEPRRPVGPNSPAQNRQQHEKEDAALEEYVTGARVADIAASYGVAAMSMYAWLKRAKDRLYRQEADCRPSASTPVE